MNELPTCLIRLTNANRHRSIYLKIVIIKINHKINSLARRRRNFIFHSARALSQSSNQRPLAMRSTVIGWGDGGGAALWLAARSCDWQSGAVDSGLLVAGAVHTRAGSGTHRAGARAAHALIHARTHSLRAHDQTDGCWKIIIIKREFHHALKTTTTTSLRKVFKSVQT